MIIESIFGATTGLNLYYLARNYRAWKNDSAKILDYDDLVERNDSLRAAFDRHECKLVEAWDENEALQRQVYDLTAPDLPWQYLFNKAMSVEEACAIDAWLETQDASLYRSSRNDEYVTAFLSGRAGMVFYKFATEDRNLAMLFKLTFGGDA